MPLKTSDVIHDAGPLPDGLPTKLDILKYFRFKKTSTNPRPTALKFWDHVIFSNPSLNMNTETNVIDSHI